MSGVRSTDPSSTIDAAAALIDRTRSAVLNVMIAAAAGVALSGWILRTRDRGATLWSPDLTRRACYVALLALVLGSTVARRVLASRSALRDPATRAPRYFRAHVTSAALGALAVPLGLLYGFAIEPRLQAVTPFWVAALAIGVLSLPRTEALEGFAEPLPQPPAPGPIDDATSPFPDRPGIGRTPETDEAGR